MSHNGHGCGRAVSVTATTRRLTMRLCTAGGEGLNPRDTPLTALLLYRSALESQGSISPAWAASTSRRHGHGRHRFRDIYTSRSHSATRTDCLSTPSGASFACGFFACDLLSADASSNKIASCVEGLKSRRLIFKDERLMPPKPSGRKHVSNSALAWSADVGFVPSQTRLGTVSHGRSWYDRVRIVLVVILLAEPARFRTRLEDA